MHCIPPQTEEQIGIFLILLIMLQIYVLSISMMAGPWMATMEMGWSDNTTNGQGTVKYSSDIRLYDSRGFC